MAEENIDICNKISDCKGLESLVTKNLPCEYKSDIVILYAHHLLTQELDYDCAEIQDNCDENGKAVYKTVDSVPANWKNNRTYKLIYKTEKETRILTAQKSNRDMVIYFSKEGFDENKYSSKIVLNNYIPNPFLKSNDLLLIDNLRELRDILLKCFSKKDKIKAKRVHDKDLIEQDGINNRRHIAHKNLPIINETNDRSTPLRNDRGCANPKFFNSKETEDKGNFTLQDEKKHMPTDKNRINCSFLDDPNYIIMAEDPEGLPDKDKTYIK